MQTFLPYPDFRKSLECLDNKRLGKQRVEAMQLINALELGGAWSNHPAALMWRGSIDALKLYHDFSIRIWEARGFKNNMEMLLTYGIIPSIDEHLDSYFEEGNETDMFPAWFGDPAFHAAHRSNLLRKDPVHYGQFGWTEPQDLPYIWPVRKLAA